MRSGYAAGARRCRRRLAVVFLLAAGGSRAWTATVAFAQAQDPEQHAESRHPAAQGRIVGVWDVTVTLRDCQTGNRLPVDQIHARNMFTAGGTLTELNARGNPILRNPSFGTWHVDGEGTYSAVFRYSRFDA